jgi:hypothetical protein
MPPAPRRPNSREPKGVIDYSASAQGLGMDDRERSASEELDYQLATRYFASAFERCERLSAADQQSLLRKISEQISQRLTAVPGEE